MKLNHLEGKHKWGGGKTERLVENLGGAGLWKNRSTKWGFPWIVFGRYRSYT